MKACELASAITKKKPVKKRAALSFDLETQNTEVDLEDAAIIQAFNSIDERAIDGFDIVECIANKEMVVFSLDSLRYPDQARLFGKLVVSDIKSAISRRPNADGDRVSLLFDEFNVFASKIVVDVVNKSRSYGFEALLSFQSLADIDAIDEGNGRDIRRQIIQNANTLIVQKQNDPQDASSLAEIIGTRPSIKLTYRPPEKGTSGIGSA